MMGISKHQQQKDAIISLMKAKGPSLPVHVARHLGVSLLFASAFLAELYAEKRIKISDMKVGGSPLYYLEGQEAMLENFIQYLQGREREAFMLLKQEQVLDDEMQTPITRVALRAIKDFAISIRVRVNEELKLFWKYFLIHETEARTIIQQKLNPPSITIPEKKETRLAGEALVEEIKENIILRKEHELAARDLTSEIKIEVKPKEVARGVKAKEVETEAKEVAKKEKKESRKAKSVIESAFTKKIKNYLSQKDIEVLDVFLEKKKEFVAKIRIDMLFGKQEFMLFAKDKKFIGENDLALALQNAQNAKMPALIFSPGDVHKKAQPYLEQWKNLVKFEKIKI